MFRYKNIKGMMGRKYKISSVRVNKLKDSTSALKNVEAIIKEARSFRNIDRPKAIFLSHKALTDCNTILDVSDVKNSVDLTVDVDMLKHEINAFLGNFSAEEIDRTLYKSEGDIYFDSARDEFLTAKDIINIKRKEAAVHAFESIVNYDACLVFFMHEKLMRAKIAEAEREKVVDFLRVFTEDEIVWAKKKALLLKEREEAAKNYI